MPPHYGTAKPENRYREQFSEDELVCARCGYDEFKCAVAIHHIDHNRQNNDKSNLLPLCMNCHMGVHNNLWKLK
jgi:5-methylcytosine-specific restriction endonuclease McrA